MTTIKLPALPRHPEPHTYRWTDIELAELRAIQIAAARAVLEAAAKHIEELPCACCWPEGSDTVAEDFATELRALRIEGGTP